MASITHKLSAKGLCNPPKWLPSNVQYETIVGSTAYGVNQDVSDFDTYGFCIPKKEDVFPHLRGEIIGFGRQKKRFEQYQQHHIYDTSAMNNTGREYDITIYSIVKYFQLVMENNPNMIDSLYTPQDCVLHITQIGQMVRDSRDLFLHKGAWHKFRGYAYSQLSKMKGKSKESKRYWMIEKYGYDCYVDSETEFLTNNGWKKFDDVLGDDKVGCYNPETEGIEFFDPLKRIEKMYTGNVYTLNSRMTKFSITENHNVYTSVAHRFKRGYEYNDADALWSLQPFNKLIKSKRSWYHIMNRCANKVSNEYSEYSECFLLLCGMFISDGTIQFRNGKVKNAVLSQTDNGKQEFIDKARMLKELFGAKEYLYEKRGKKEYSWVLEKKLAVWLYQNFGHGSKQKRLASWCFNLDYDEAGLLFHGLFLGDGTTTKNGNVVYTSNRLLANDIQIMMVLTGYSCSVRGPYKYKSNFGDAESYQIYLSDESRYNCVDLKNRTKRKFVKNERVVCFDTPTGILVTRNSGKIAIQGNCKFAYHVVRLVLEVEQILTEGTLDLRRNADILKAIRNGEWTEQRIRQWFTDKETALEPLYHSSDLQYKPDESKIKELLLNCLEQHYGSLNDAIVKPNGTLSLVNEIETVLEKYK